ncbi:Glycosyltransferase involved in cell wall bisynthesis [Tardiphaga sp. OK246]|uniref:glycosyltransferase n=1 Tax=Tardiphaga sp. OK246 TaxID=1855307 RepID=UPI000B6BE0D4|nr:glycosyltransferase [Tardiphaga sp. OK246]SNT63972.1 Glycosyltransferase involved in cell wall bisynthesis [Tardiphaga sp. OK246]
MIPHDRLSRILDDIVRSLSRQAIEIETVLVLGGGDSASVSSQLWRKETQETAPWRMEASALEVKTRLDAPLIGQSDDTRSDCVLLHIELCTKEFIGGLRSLSANHFAVHANQDGLSDRAIQKLVKLAFDVGFIALAGDWAQYKTVVFLRSERIVDLSGIGGPEFGRVSMSTLGRNGRFANQLFQHIYIRFYALRHSLVASHPNWIGEVMYGLPSPPAITEAKLPELRFYAFDNDDLYLWRMQEAVYDVDLWGYFQETPECWQPHRALLRRMHSLAELYRAPVRQAIERMTDDGRRPLVALHVRRGDYLQLHQEGLPWYRLVPEEWYAAWLDRLLPSLRDPVVFIATDDVDLISAKFAQYHPVYARDLDLPDTLQTFMFDFEVLRQAGYLAICNSSFSRFAAILAEDSQRCVAPELRVGAFVPYQPWTDQQFWSRFEEGEKASPSFGYGRQSAAARGIMLRQERGKSNAALEDYERIRLSLVEAYEAGQARASKAEERARQEADRAAAAEQRAFFPERMNLRSIVRGSLRAMARVVFLTLAALMRKVSAWMAPRFPGLSGRLGGGVRLLEQRRYREFLGGSKRGLKWLVRRVAGRIGAGLGGRVPTYRACFSEAVPRQRILSPKIRLLHGYGCENTKAALSRQSIVLDFASGYGAVDAVEVLFASEADFVCIVADGAVLDTTALEVAVALSISASIRPGIVCLSAHESGASAAVAGSRAIGAVVLPSDLLNAVLPNIAHPPRPGNLLKDLPAVHRELAKRNGEVILPGLVDLLGGRQPLFVVHDFSREVPREHLLTRAGSADAARDLAQTLASIRRRPELQARAKLLVVVPWLPRGGSEVLLLDILTSLASAWSIHLVTTLADEHVMSNAFLEVVADVYHLGNVFDSIRIKAFVSGLIAALQPAVVLSSNSSLHYDLLPELKAMNPLIHFIDVIHNDLPEGHIASAQMASSALTKHIAISRRVAQSLTARGVPADRIALIENGVDTSLFKPEGSISSACVEPKAAAKRLKLLFIGRFSPEKRPMAFLDVVAHLSSHHPVEAKMVGHGPQGDLVRQRIKDAGLSVTLLDEYPRSNLADLYRTADILVLTSTVEGMPLVALEALAAGCPVAATDVGDLRRIIVPGSNGFLVPVEQPELIGNVLADFVGQAEGGLWSLREKARASVIEAGMDYDTMIGKYSSLFSSLLVRQ